MEKLRLTLFSLWSCWGFSCRITTEKLDFNYDKEWDVFCKTSLFIAENFGEDAFSGKTKGGDYRNEFILYYFDALFVPIAKLIDSILDYADSKKVGVRINEIKFGE